MVSTFFFCYLYSASVLADSVDFQLQSITVIDICIDTTFSARSRFRLFGSVIRSPVVLVSNIPVVLVADDMVLEWSLFDEPPAIFVWISTARVG